MPKTSSENTRMLTAFEKRNALKKGKENKQDNMNQEDSIQAIEKSRKEFAAEYLAKYGDADIERRAIPISSNPSFVPVSINQINFNPNVYTPEYNCSTFIDILKKYNKNKNDIDKIKLRTLLNDLDCREIDTIGENKNDPINWNIPDGQFKLLLNELEIFEPYNDNINNIIKTRQNAKPLTYRIIKSTIGVKGGKTKRTQRPTKRKHLQRTRKRTHPQRKFRKNKV